MNDLGLRLLCIAHIARRATSLGRHDKPLKVRSQTVFAQFGRNWVARLRPNRHSPPAPKRSAQAQCPCEATERPLFGDRPIEIAQDLVNAGLRLQSGRRRARLLHNLGPGLAGGDAWFDGGGKLHDTFGRFGALMRDGVTQAPLAERLADEKTQNAKIGQ